MCNGIIRESRWWRVFARKKVVGDLFGSVAPENAIYYWYERSALIEMYEASQWDELEAH